MTRQDYTATAARKDRPVMRCPLCSSRVDRDTITIEELGPRAPNFAQRDGGCDWCCGDGDYED
jgi:hypothetical protein